MIESEQAALPTVSIGELSDGFVRASAGITASDVAVAKTSVADADAYADELARRGELAVLAPLMASADASVAGNAARRCASLPDCRERALATLEHIASTDAGRAGIRAKAARNNILFGNPYGDPNDAEWQSPVDATRQTPESKETKPALFAAARFLGMALILMIAAALLEGITDAAMHKRPPTPLESSTLARAEAFQPFELLALYWAALGKDDATDILSQRIHALNGQSPSAPPTAAGARSTLAPGELNSVPLPSATRSALSGNIPATTPAEKNYPFVKKVCCVTPQPVSTFGSRVLSELHSSTEATLAPATPPPVVYGVRLHYWAGPNFSLLSIPLAFADVVYGLFTSGPLGTKFFAFAQIALGLVVTLWTVQVMPFVWQRLFRKAAYSPPSDTVLFLWIVPIGTIVFASLMSPFAQVILILLAHVFGLAQNAYADAFADMSVVGLGAAFARSAAELRVHAAVEAGMEAVFKS